MAEAAFQIAVWEIAYEATGAVYDLASGAASFAGGTAASSGALTLASTWLANLASGGPTINVLDSRVHQDVIYAPVPEPVDGVSDGRRAPRRERRGAQEGKDKRPDHRFEPSAGRAFVLQGLP